MKIGMISNSWRPVRSGVTTVLEEAAKYLRARGHEVVFIAPEHAGCQDDEWPTLRLPSIPLQQDYRSVAPWISLLPSFWRKVAALNLDIVHAHDSVPLGAGHLGAIIRRRLGTPLVITQHCFYDLVAMDHCCARPGGKWLGRALLGPFRMAMRRVLRSADLVLAPSAAAASDVQRFRPEGAVVLPSGVDVPAIQPNGQVRKVRARLGLGERQRLLLNVGRLDPDKNLGLLLDAFALASRQHANSVLALVGDGPLRRRLERRARELGVEDRVHFIGSVPHQEVWNWYAASDLLVSTSPRETQGLVLLEAMHMGVPVVAMDQGGASSVVRHEHDGILVPSAADAVSSAISRILADPQLRERMSGEARLRAREFDSQVLVADLESHYLRLLNKPRDEARVG